MNITEFLEARITEDEEVARSAGESPGGAGPRWFNYFKEVLGQSPDAPVADAQSSWYSDHIARQDPARVLAECSAKRAVIEWWTNGVIGYVESDGKLTNPLLPLAAVYADHPDYDAEWAK